MQLTTMEIAARIGKSERTIQRWIAGGKLPALHVEGNVYEVSEDDLQPHLPHAIVDSLAQRIAALERQVSELQGLLQQPAPRRATAIATTTLPEGLVLIKDLAEQYKVPENTATRNMRPYLKKGPWKVGGHSVTNALDSGGVAEFMRRYGSK